MKLLLINLLCSLVMLQACTKDKQKKMQNDNYSYSVTFSAPGKTYPAEVHYGYLTDDLGRLISGVPKAGVTNGLWQYDGSKAGQGGSTIPSHLELVYVAYAEKKFYKVDAKLPKDKILALFREGFIIKAGLDNTGKRLWEKATYETLNIGAAPKGVIVVWLSGNHHRREVCRLEAKEITIDKNEFLPHRVPDETQQQFFDSNYDFYVPADIRAKIKRDGIPFGLWDKYREKFNYRFSLASYDDKDFIKQLFRINYNGESEYLVDKEAVQQYKEDSIPYNVVIQFTNNNVEIVFDDTELLRAFGELKKQYPNEPIDIVLKPEFRYKDFKTFVKCKDKEIQLQNITIKRAWGKG